MGVYNMLKYLCPPLLTLPCSALMCQKRNEREEDHMDANCIVMTGATVLLMAKAALEAFVLRGREEKANATIKAWYLLMACLWVERILSALLNQT